MAIKTIDTKRGILKLEKKKLSSILLSSNEDDEEIFFDFDDFIYIGQFQAGHIMVPVKPGYLLMCQGCSSFIDYRSLSSNISLVSLPYYGCRNRLRAKPYIRYSFDNGFNQGSRPCINMFCDMRIFSSSEQVCKDELVISDYVVDSMNLIDYDEPIVVSIRKLLELYFSRYRVKRTILKGGSDSVMHYNYLVEKYYRLSSYSTSILPMNPKI